jgi:hypothetical protein
MPGSTNFVPWNPSQINQESDAAYASDSQRVGGAPNGVAFPSATGNKLFYQVSVGITALMQMMAAKGFTVNDTNLATLTSVLAAIRTTADIASGLDSISYSSAITCDAAAFIGFQISLAGNTTLTVTGVAAGQSLIFIFVQDSAGGHIVTWPGTFFGGLQPDPTPNSVSVIVFDIDTSLNGRVASPSLSSNGITGTPIGVTNPSAANFSALQFNGSAPSGQVLAGNGTSFVPTVAPGFSSGGGSGAYWTKDPSGLIRQWGQITTDINGGTLSVPFPVNFTNAASISVVASTLSSHDRIIYIVEGSVSVSGFSVGNNGSDGFGYWQAVGY